MGLAVIMVVVLINDKTGGERERERAQKLYMNNNSKVQNGEFSNKHAHMRRIYM